MRILLVGGAGFIGHTLVDILQKGGHIVSVIDNFTNYGDLVIKKHNQILIPLRRAVMGNIPVTQLDITNSDDFDHYSATAMQNDVIIHLASYPNDKLVRKQPSVAADTMISALLRMLRLAKQTSATRFVFISSSMVYGDFLPGVTEDAACNPKGAYGIMKLAGEMLVKDYCAANCIDYTIVRPTAVYGPRDMMDRVSARFLVNALRGQPLTVNGKQEQLDLTCVTDTADGIALAATSKNARNQTYNVSLGEGYLLRYAAKVACQVTKSQSTIQLNPTDESFPSRGRMSINKAVAELGYSPNVTLEQGYAQYAKWLIENPALWN